MTQKAKITPIDEETVKKGNPNWSKGVSGNPVGRPKDKDRLDKLSKRELKDREFLMILRKIRPHIADSIMTAATIMKNEKATEAGKLKAAAMLLDNYRKLVLDMYDGEEEPDVDNPEIQEQNKPVFSLRVIDNESDE